MVNGAWVDTHCHLDSIDDEPAGIIQRGVDAGVETFVTVGTDVSTSERSVELAESHARVRAAVGVHPNEAADFNADSLATIEKLASSPRVAAIGEIGLDFYRDYCPPDRQEAAFRQQLTLAKALNLPVILHIREAYAQALEILSEAGPPEKLVFHCFSGGLNDAEQALALGAYLSFAGNISYKNADALRETARSIPLDRLLVETDAPYLAPVPHRGKPNEPAYVPEVGRALAEAVGRSVDEVSEATTANAIRAFNLDNRQNVSNIFSLH